MKKLAILNLVLFLSCFAVKSQPSIKWQHLLGGDADDFFLGYGGKATSDGGSILAGASASNSGSGSLTGITNDGGYDGWVVKMNSGGTTTWQKLFGGTANDEFIGVVPTPDGGYIAVGDAISSNSGTLTGFTNHGGRDAWVVKMNSSGNVTWQKLLGGSNDDYFSSVRPASDGGYIICGDSYSSNSGTLAGFTNQGDRDGWVVKLNSNGDTQWQVLLGNTGEDMFAECTPTTDGGFIAAGHYTSEGAIGYGGWDGWLVKLDASGNITWSKFYGGTLNDQLGNVEQTPDGGYITDYIAGSKNTGTLTGDTLYGAGDGWVMKTDANGNVQWQDILGGTSFDYFLGCTLTSDGGYLLSGESNSIPANGGTLTGLTNHGTYDGWVVKLNSSGAMEWQELLGGSSDDHLFGNEQNTDGGYVVEGWSSSSDGTLAGVTNYPFGDAWVIKFSPLSVKVTSSTNPPTCSTNSITYKVTGGTSPYSVQLYRFGTAYGSPSSTSKNVTFSNLPSGSYYATASGAGQDGVSSTVTLVPTLTNTSTSNITATKATLNWFVASCASYNSVEYRVHGTTTWTKKKTTGNPDFYTLKSLTPSTTYDWKVAAVDTLNKITATGNYTDSLVFTTHAQKESVNTNSNTINATVYPNPASTQLHVQLENQEGNVDLILKDVNGKTVWSALNIDSENSGNLTVDVSSLLGGIYLLQVSNLKNVIVTKKIVIER